ncbi:MAG: hypothetical protein P0120_19190 [Nitrospira sp.]|nr:hypothetical protein [Nitrospira sp.]
MTKSSWRYRRFCLRAHQAPTSPLYPKIGFTCTDHPITVWPGAILLRLYFELWGYGLALDAERFEHFTRYRRDLLLSRLLKASPFSLAR